MPNHVLGLGIVRGDVVLNQLRQVLAAVDPASLTREDRLALLDLFEKSIHAATAGGRRSDGATAQLVQYLADGVLGQRGAGG